MKKEYKDIFFQRQTHDPHPHKRGTSGLCYKQPLCACGVACLFKNISLCSFLLVMIFIVPNRVFASVAGDVNQANELYRKGQFEDSLKLYEEAADHDSDSPLVKYDLGTALYKKGDYDRALGYLEQAAQDKNLKIKPKAEYNLGNVLYQSGMKKASTNVNEAIKSLQEALGHYDQTIQYDPKDQDAQYNEDYVKKEIERLKQMKQQQQQQEQNSNQQQKQQNQKDQQTQEGQQGQKNQQSQQQQQKQQGQQAKPGQQKQDKKQQAQQGKAQDQKNQQSSAASKEQQQAAQQQTKDNQKEIDRKQAEDMLEEYRENEEPKKLLNYMPKKIDDRPVLKDW